MLTPQEKTKRSIVSTHKSYPRRDDAVDPLYDYPPTVTWNVSALHWLRVEFDGDQPLGEMLPADKIPSDKSLAMEIVAEPISVSPEELMKMPRVNTECSEFSRGLRDYQRELGNRHETTYEVQLEMDELAKKHIIPDEDQLKSWEHKQRRQLREDLECATHKIAWGLIIYLMDTLYQCGIERFFDITVLGETNRDIYYEAGDPIKSNLDMVIVFTTSVGQVWIPVDLRDTTASVNDVLPQEVGLLIAKACKMYKRVPQHSPRPYRKAFLISFHGTKAYISSATISASYLECLRIDPGSLNEQLHVKRSRQWDLKDTAERLEFAAVVFGVTLAVLAQFRRFDSSVGVMEKAYGLDVAGSSMELVEGLSKE